MDAVKATRKTKKKKPKKNAFKCEQCFKIFADKGALTKHGYIHSSETYPCELCDYVAQTRQYLRRHLGVKHRQKEKEFECGVCGMRFHFGCKLRDHMRVHTGEKPHKCDECGKAFNALYSLTTHKLIHSNSKPYQCVYCDYACRDNSTLRKHQARHTGTEKYYQCKMCSHGTKSKARLKRHIAEKHFNVNVRTHICDTCGKGFKDKTNLSIHIQAVHEKSRTVQCEVCHFTISNRNNMAAHMRTHIDLRPYVCTFDKCGRTFKDTSSLSKHKVTHDPSSWFTCKICARRFSRRARLIKHLDTHRAKEKTTECDYCGVKFYNKNYLARHIQRKHTKKKQKFICDMCDFKTTNKPSIVMHIKYGHAFDNEIQCKMCVKKFKRDYNLKLHYWRAHGIKYKITYKKKPKKPVIIIKTEPEDSIEDSEYFIVEPKIEPLDEDDIILQNLVTNSEAQLEDISKEVFQELIDSREIRPEDDKPPERKFVDRRTDNRVKKAVSNLLERTRRRVAELALEKTRRKYNLLMKKAIARKARAEARKKIYYNNKNTVIEKTDSLKGHEKDDEEEEEDSVLQSHEPNTDALLVEHYSISQKTIEEIEKPVDNPNPEITFSKNIRNKLIDKGYKLIENTNRDIEENIHPNNTNNRKQEELVEKVTEPIHKVNTEENANVNNSENNNEEKQPEDESEVNNDSEENVEDLNSNDINVDAIETSKETPLGNNGKLKLNTVHQCYVCFKLFESTEKLLEHCKDHFDLCSTKRTLKKCPLCEYVTSLSLKRHLKHVHKVNIKIAYGTFKDAKQDGSRYYYDVNDPVIDKVEIIPSIKNLNNQAYKKIDKKNRDAKNKAVMKTKLVKKGDEWIVMKEKMKINDYMLPKFDKIDSLRVKGDYVERMKALSRMAKKNGAKILFPCDKCSKICQTLAALKLHGRKHEKNPKPFKPKVWKHKLKDNLKVTVPKETVPKTNTKRKKMNTDTYVKRDRRKRQDGITNEEYRIAKPQPVISKHRCEKELIDFYEKNIKGGDIEFWQFLKIYNKLGRENVNDFSDLEKTTEFGVHSAVQPEQKKEKVRKKMVKRDAFNRVVRLSRKEVMKRNAIREKLREKIRQANS